jgi:hypothetical protein
MTRAGFMDAVGILAAEMAATRMRDAGLDPPMAAGGVCPALRAEAVAELLALHLAPLSGRLASSTGVRSQLGSADVVAVLAQGAAAMRAVFTEFADIVEGGRPKDGAAIDALAQSEGAFCAMLVSLTLLSDEAPAAGAGAAAPPSPLRGRAPSLAPDAGDRAPNAGLTRAEATQAFKLAQSEDEGGAEQGTGVQAAVDDDDIHGPASSPSDGLTELDFQECVEAFAHVSLSKWRDPGVPLAQKLAWLLDLIDEWLERHGRRVEPDGPADRA